MKANARHDLRHPIAAIFLIGSTADAFGSEFGADMLARCREEIVEELARFRALAQRHDVRIDVSELAWAVAAFARDPSSAARGLAVQQACRDVLRRLETSGDGRRMELDTGDLEGTDAVEL
jgi:signal transduction histidine kinase